MLSVHVSYVSFLCSLSKTYFQNAKVSLGFFVPFFGWLSYRIQGFQEEICSTPWVDVKLDTTSISARNFSVDRTISISWPIDCYKFLEDCNIVQCACVDFSLLANTHSAHIHRNLSNMLLSLVFISFFSARKLSLPFPHIYLFFIEIFLWSPLFLLFQTAFSLVLCGKLYSNVQILHAVRWFYTHSYMDAHISPIFSLMISVCMQQSWRCCFFFTLSFLFIASDWKTLWKASEKEKETAVNMNTMANHRARWEFVIICFR